MKRVKESIVLIMKAQGKESLKEQASKLKERILREMQQEEDEKMTKQKIEVSQVKNKNLVQKSYQEDTDLDMLEANGTL